VTNTLQTHYRRWSCTPRVATIAEDKSLVQTLHSNTSSIQLILHQFRTAFSLPLTKALSRLHLKHNLLSTVLLRGSMLSIHLPSDSRSRLAAYSRARIRLTLPSWGLLVSYGRSSSSPLLGHAQIETIAYGEN
jgi:hypothetical protein